MNTKPRSTSMAVANWFVDHVPDISPLKLQKLIYFAHGWHLALRDQPLIDEYIEAWDYGPVVPSVYHEFKEFGNRPINIPGTAIERIGDTKFRIITPRLSPESHQSVEALLKKIDEVYGGYSALRLSADTHKVGTPWEETRKSQPNRKGVDIPDELIQAYFKKLIRPPKAYSIAK
jgi:uncharacterized phage-associated protein